MLMRKFACAALILAMSGVAIAEEFRGKITKVDGGKVTFQVFNKDDKKFEDAKTYDLAKDVKVNKRIKKDEKEALAEGLKNEVFTKIDAAEGVRATIVVTDSKVTEIIVGRKKTN
jgi:hypothetical protein